MLMNNPLTLNKMKAAILTEQKKPLFISDHVELPTTLSIGQVLVKVLYSGICGSQLGEIDGTKGEDKFLPHLMGHEGTGIVLEIGPGVRYVSPGDHVVLHWRKGLGIESEPPSYKMDGKKINAGWVTTFNEYAIVSENRLTTIPADTNMKLAALFGCAVLTGFGVITRNAKLTIGESVVVFGAGGVGLNIIQAAALVNANPIIGIDIYDNKLALAKTMGATHIINAYSQDAKKSIEAILGKSSLDVFIDNTGRSSIIEMGYNLVGQNGRVVLVGVPKIGDNISIYSLPLHFGKKIIGSHGGEAIPQLDIPRYNHLHQNKKLKLAELITHEYTLDEINTAIEDMRSGKINGRCLIKISDHE